jgi:hypothetical protein
MTRLITATLFAAFAGFASTGPAAAQEGGDYRVNQLIIYGDDECPASSSDEITVCARKDEGDRFRIPEGSSQPGLD